jgi:PDDEXK-like domain of unknown function (DUF3799)
MILLPLGLHHDIPVDQYRADPAVNQSTLKAFGRAPTPYHFRYDREHPKEETAELRIGSYVDGWMFSNKLLDTNFAIWKDRRQGNAWKEFEEANKSKTILNSKEHERASGAIKAVCNHDDSVKIVNACSTQVIAIAEHPVLKCRMKGAIDLLPDLGRCSALLAEYAFDLKTSADASPEGFAMQCWRLGYAVQAAFYGDLLELCGRKTSTFGFIVVENEPPHQVAIHYFKRDSIEIIEARKKYEGWMKAYLSCVETNNWPGYGSEWTRIEFKPWQLSDRSWERELMV